MPSPEESTANMTYTENHKLDIQLFAFSTSPYAMKVACYLAYKNIDFKFEGVSPVTFKEVSFTGRKQVPVLKINDEWRLESSEIGKWLEEKFPQRPMLGLSATERALILTIDQWVSNQLIPSMFRLVVDWPSISTGLSNGWKLAAAVNQVTPLPRWLRLMWPILLRRANFIQALMMNVDRSKTHKESQKAVISQFVEHLQSGPYLGGLKQPTLADFSAYPVIVFPYRFGLGGSENWLSEKKVSSWASLVQQHLPENPFLVPESLLVRELKPVS